MHIEKNTVFFASGRKRNISNGIIGLDPILDVYEGYDGHFYNPSFELKECNPLTKEELLELADFMISQWSAFRNRVLRS